MDVMLDFVKSWDAWQQIGFFLGVFFISCLTLLGLTRYAVIVVRGWKKNEMKS